jgi:recombination protein RecT
MSNALEQARTQPLRQVKSVKQLLMNDNARDQLAAVAAKHMSPERMMRVVASAIRTTPKLQECDPMSFLGALMQCAALGLGAE